MLPTPTRSRNTRHRPNGLRRFWHHLGPGLTTGAADDDPSGIATYSQTGSRYGFRLLWLAAFTFPFMAVVQEMCARIGLVTGRGLAANIRREFPAWMLYTTTGLLFLANTFNIGADLGAMAAATRLLAPELSFGILLIGFTAVSLLLQIFLPYARYARFLKWLSLVLLAYVLTALTLKDVDWGAVARGALLPSVDLTRDQILLLCGILGTTISPYLFFWQTSQEVEEEIADGKTTVASREGASDAVLQRMRVDVWSGMFFSNAVMFFVILTCGAVLHAAGITSITTAADAAAALRPLAGQYATLLFCIGIVGVGLLAIPVLAGSAAYALAECFRWKEGLSRTLRSAGAFYAVIIVSVVVGLLLNFVGLDPMRALLYAAVGNGIVAPVVLLCIMKLGGDRRVMGTRANGRVSTVLGWTVTVLMLIVAIASLFALL